MRRGLRLPCLAVALVVGVLGGGTVAAQDPDAPPITRKRFRLGPAHDLDWMAAEQLDRRLRARGIAVDGGNETAAERSPIPAPGLPSSAEPAASASLASGTDATLVDGVEPLSPKWTTGFRALGDSLTAPYPPHTQGAVGPTELITALLSQVKRQDRSGTQIGALTSLYGFWVAAGVSPTPPPLLGPFAPRVVFDPDPAPGHFVMVSCQAQANQSSALLLAVSTGSTAASWYAWKIPADTNNLPGSGVWFDEPTVGFNGKWIVVQVNVYHYGTSTDFVESRIYVFDKNRLRQGLPSTPTVFDLAPSFGKTQVPAATYDPSADLYLVQRWTHDALDGYGYLRLYQLTGSVGSEGLNPLGLARAPAWSDSAPGLVDFAPQGPGCGTDRIQTNDSRIQNVVQRGNALWTTHTVFYPPGGAPQRASVRWWQLGLDAAVLQTGLVEDPTNARFYAFPSIAVNQRGDALLGFSTFSAADHASAAYAFRLAGDDPGTMQAPQVFKAGEACYYKSDGSRNRWGDYSASQVDPFDDTRFWTIQEYSSATDYNNVPAANVWSTWWVNVEPPLVSIADASVAEGNTGTTALTFNLTLSVPVSETVSVHWETADGSAKAADNDYIPASGDVAFPPNQTTASVTVDVVGDLKHELDEQFTVVLSSPKYATLGNTQATGTILNDEPAPLMSIGDAQVVEGDTGSTNAVFTVSLSYPSTVPISAAWLAKADTATLNVDFGAAGGTVTFDPGVVTTTVTVPVFGDTLNEGNETFLVELSPPSAGTLLKKTGVGLILDDDQVLFEPVSGLVVVSDGDSTTGRNRLQWLNPTPRPSGVRIRFVSGTTPCPAIGLGGEPWGTLRPDGEDVDLGPTPPAAQSWTHPSLSLNTDYCYGVWAYYGGSSWSSGAVAKGRPFNATGKVKWKYNTGMTALANPTVGQVAVLAPGNDRFVHAMTPGPGPAGGGWPPLWVPVNLGSEAQARSPIVPIGGISLAFYTTQDGWVHAIDAATGARLWDAQIATGPTSGQAAPAAILAGWGGGWDYLLVGTRMASGNKFYALDPLNGSVIDVFPRGMESGISGLGPINGMAAVDYPSRRVYFGSLPGTVPDAPGTLWCLQLGPPSDALSLGWSTAAPGPIETSPVLRGDRVYVGDMNGVVWSVRMDGGNAYSIPLLDGKVKGFPWPDRRNNLLYVTTQTKVWGLTDTVGSSLSSKWSVPGLDSPSPVLLKPGTNDLYVGVRDIVPSGPPDSAGLLRMDVSLPNPSSSVTAVAIEDSAMIVGPPSLDIRPNPNMIYVGSDGGVIYAVEASF